LSQDEVCKSNIKQPEELLEGGLNVSTSYQKETEVNTASSDDEENSEKAPAYDIYEL
jgi:hypothetical protein